MSVIEVDGDFEKAVKSFAKQVERDGVLSELRRRRCFEKPSTIRRRKRFESMKRAVLKKRERERR